MKRLLKCYHIFLPKIWGKPFLYLVYPLLLILLMVKIAGNHTFASYGVAIGCALAMFAEILVDMVVLGGVASKDTNKLEYLKTSVRGMDVLRNCIVIDGIRRALSLIFIVGVSYVIGGIDLTVMQLAVSVACTLMLMELGLVITRNFPSMTVVMLTASIGEWIAVALIMLICSKAITGFILFSAMLIYLCVCILERIMIMKKARGSYYDGED